MPTYKADIPQASDTLSQSQTDLLNNFDALQDFMESNHYDANSAYSGKHKVVQFPVAQSADPATAAGEMALYTKTVSGSPHLFLRGESSGTALDLTLRATSGGVTYTYLPSGLIMQFGLTSVSAGSPTTITLATAYATTNYSILITPSGNGTNPTAIVGYNSAGGGVTTTTFQIRTDSAAAVQVRWMTIGV